MKRFPGLFYGLLLIALVASPLICTAEVHVRGYTRKDGTYVAPHTRSSPSKSSGTYAPAPQPAPVSANTSEYPAASEKTTAYGPTAKPIPPFPLIQLKDGTKLTNVRIISTAATYVLARWNEGSGTIKLSEMPESALNIIYASMLETSQAAKPTVPEEPAPTAITVSSVVTPPASPSAPVPAAVAPSPVTSTADPAPSFIASIHWREILPPLGVIGAIGLLIVGVLKYAKAQEDERKRRAEYCVAAARQFVNRVTQQGGLRPVTTSLMLKKDEQPFLSERVSLYETRAVRQGSTVGFRVYKGVWLGQSTSHSTDQMTLIDSGLLTVTNQRLVFDGNQTNRSVPLEKIMSVNPGLDVAEVSCEGRQKSMVFTVSNGLILGSIIHICRKAENPLRLTEPLNFTFRVE